MAFISSLMREKRAGNVSSTLGITTEYCGTFSSVGGSDASMLVKIVELASLCQARTSSLKDKCSESKGAFHFKTCLASEISILKNKESFRKYVRRNRDVIFLKHVGEHLLDFGRKSG